MEQEPTGGERFLGLLAYLGPFVLIPLLVRQKHRFLVFHTRQGLYFFSVSALVMAVLLGIFLLSQKINVPFLDNVMAVLVAMWGIVYVVVALFMAATTLQNRMVMLPMLGELAGER